MGVRSGAPKRGDDPGSYYARPGPIGDLFRAWECPPAWSDRRRGPRRGHARRVRASRGRDRVLRNRPACRQGRAATPSCSRTCLIGPRRPSVVIGDGRLLVADEPDDSIDLLIMDAFSSDAPPGHLLTLEAFQDADRALADGGILVVHVSNRYYDLGRPVSGALEAAGFEVLERAYTPTGQEADAGAGISHWVVATRDERRHSVSCVQRVGLTPDGVGLPHRRLSRSAPLVRPLAPLRFRSQRRPIAPSGSPGDPRRPSRWRRSCPRGAPARRQPRGPATRRPSRPAARGARTSRRARRRHRAS